MNTAAARRPKITTKQALGIAGGLLGLCWVILLALHPGDQLTAAVGGLSQGALVAAIAISVTLTYRGSGVVNFSAAAVSMYAAFFYNDLRTDGSIFLPPPLPTFQLLHPRTIQGQFFPVTLAPMPAWVAFVITIAFCVLMGLVFHFLVFRPLRNAPPLAKVVASVGILILLMESANLRFPTSVNFNPILPLTSWKLGAVAISEENVILLAIIVILAAVFWAVFKYTSFGLATRAAAENERGALILGYNPNRYAAINWVLSTVLAGGLGVLFASINGSIDTVTIPLLIVPALAASLLGRFTSFPLTVIAALLLGAGDAWIQGVGGQSWVPSVLTGNNWAATYAHYALPFIVIVLVLFIGGERLPTRGTITTMRLPRAPVPRNVGVKMAVVFAIVFVLAFTVNPDWREALQTSILASIICSSLVVLTGFIGQISLMQMTLAGVAGLVLSKFCDVHGIGFPWGPLIAASAATLVGLLAAIPALRIRGVNLAVVTLSAAVLIEQVVYNLPAFASNFGSGAGNPVNPPTIFGLHFGPNDPWHKIFGLPHGKLPNPWFSVFCLIVALLVAAAVVWIRRAPLGRRMLAVRSNERAAAAAGVNVERTKLIAFAISAFIAGIGGCMFSYSFQSVDPVYFGSFSSIVFLAIAYLGGIAVVSGAGVGGIIAQGGLFATFLLVAFHINPDYSIMIAGFGLIFASINNPEGIAGTLRDNRERRLRKRALKRAGSAEAGAPVAKGVSA